MGVPFSLYIAPAILASAATIAIDYYQNNGFPFLHESKPASNRFLSESKPSSKGPIQGRATVIDGNTIEIHGQRIRFSGIDAPEPDQLCANAKGEPFKCGAEAAIFLQLLLEKSPPTKCNFVEWDQHGQYVGDCYRADGLSVSAALVRSGYAFDWSKYSGGTYKSYENLAKAEKVGMWQGKFKMPREYRAEK